MRPFCRNISGIIYSALLVSLVLLIACKTQKPLTTEASRVFTVAEQQYENMLKVATDLTRYPRGGAADGTLRYVGIGDWTGGFWPGCLWYVYENNKQDKWKEAAIRWTESLEKNQFNTNHHDIGFMMNNSYGHAYRFTGKKEYKDILIQSAKSLLKRYNPAVGSIQSWNTVKSAGGNTWEFPVIIDNMMNLELLFLVSEFTGDTTYKQIAIRHAETTMKNHLRPDYSSYHVVNYDKVSGKVLHQQAAQGFSDNSTWARGHAWGVYGFVSCYRYLKDERYLQTAERMADFYLDHPNLPADKIPYWDFNAGQPGYNPEWTYDPSKHQPVLRDASAAAIISSALLELSTYSNASKKKKYYEAAIKMLQTLSSSEYLAAPGSNNNFVLKHSVGHYPKNSEVDVPIIYADYYFLEALLRQRTGRFF